MNNAVSIEPFQMKYREAFSELNLEWIRSHFVVEPKDIEQLENPEDCIRMGGHILFAVHDGKAIGTCALYRLNDDRFELAKMAVRPSARGQGIGEMLMRSAEQWVRISGAKEIMLHSNTALEAAIALYLKHGYVVTRLGSHPDYERANIEMVKTLRVED